MTDKWQGLMDAAYQIWKDGNRGDVQTYEDMLEAVPELNKMAVLIGNFNYQIGNGGFSQWIFNGYSEQYPELMRALEKVDQTAAVRKTVEILQAVKRVFEEAGFDDIADHYEADIFYEQECEEVYDEETEEYDEECYDVEYEEEIPVYTDHLDETHTNAFYQVSDDFERDVATWFANAVADTKTIKVVRT